MTPQETPPPNPKNGELLALMEKLGYCGTIYSFLNDNVDIDKLLNPNKCQK